MFAMGSVLLVPKQPAPLPVQNMIWTSSGNGTTSDITSSSRIWTARTSGAGIGVWNKAAGNSLRTLGNYYCEVTVLAPSAPGTHIAIGIASSTVPTTSASGDNAGNNGRIQYFGDGSKSQVGTLIAYGASYDVGDVIGIALQQTSSPGPSYAYSLTLYKNGVSQGVMYSGPLGGLGGFYPHVCYFGDGSAGSMQWGSHVQYLPPGYTVWN